MAHRLSGLAELRKLFQLVNWYGERLEARAYRIGLRLFYEDLIAAIELGLQHEVPFMLANEESWLMAAGALQTRVDQLGASGDSTEMILPERPYWYEWSPLDQAQNIFLLAEGFRERHEQEVQDRNRDGVAMLTVGEVFDLLSNVVLRASRARFLMHREEIQRGSRTLAQYRRFEWLILAHRELRQAALYYGEQIGPDRDRQPAPGGPGPWSGGPHG